MAEDLKIDTAAGKREKYELLLPQVFGLVKDEKNTVANAANIAAALRQTFNFFWVGFYFVDNDELILGPFQGDIACTRIGFGKGVCGACWEKERTLIVDDVEAFPGHIACSSLSKSEIVVPVIKDGEIRSILDVDSDELNDFDKIDQFYLEQIAEIFANTLS